jgi:putative serine protease PepD
MEDRPDYAPVPQPRYEGQPAPPPYTPSPAPPPYPTPVAPSPPARERAPRARTGFGAVLAAALLGGVVGAAAVGGVLWGVVGLRGAPAPAPVTANQVSTSATLPLPAEPIEAVAAKLVPSVVNIVVDLPGAGSAIGSGVIIRSDGYVLTNNHVVEGAGKIVVRLGTTDYTATVVGTDPSSDLAVIKIAKTGLTAAALGSSADLQVGETVVAVGSPFGLDKTVTSGIVSALHRTNLQQGQSGVTAYTNLIQTDAPINPGNSGGALADLSGAVVGINTLILSPSGQLGTSQSAGIGFAIPIDFAKNIADQLIAGKKITHPFMGVSTATVDQATAQSYNLPVTSGALVQQLVSGSPAASAGIKVGDIIVNIDQTPIATSEDVFTAVRSATVGQKIQVEVVRGSQHLTLAVKLGAQ